jgi:hypothetical protein
MYSTQAVDSCELEKEENQTEQRMKAYFRMAKK